MDAADVGTQQTSLLPPVPSETGRRLRDAIANEYELRGILGAGGFAEVYLAWDRALKREVAVKALRVELGASHEILERFRREAEAIAHLRHPHIVPIYSVAERDHIAWFVMPRVEGVSLADALRHQERWSFAESARILRETAGALSTAHAAGIVHRDIKPENIMLEGPDRRVVLMDFGIAKSLDPGIASGLTGTGMMIGTPQFMSPEQTAGDPQIGAASDQYSLGLVGYRLLTGMPAFEADTLGALMMKQATTTPTPVREHRPDTPVALARVIERALEKDPDARFPSMTEFSEALDRVAKDVAGEFRRGRRAVPMAERTANARRRFLEVKKPSIIAIAAGLVLTVTGVLGAGSSGMLEALRRRDQAAFVARMEATQAGLAPDVHTPTFVGPQAVYDVLQKALGRDSLDRVASEEYRLWRWSFGLGDRRESAIESTGLDGKARTVFASLPVGSSTTGHLPLNAARRIADSVLRSHGDDPALLQLTTIDSVRYPAYTSYTWRWIDPARTVVSGHDTVRVRVIVRLGGERVLLYGHFGAVTGPSGSARANDWIRVAIGSLFPFMLVALGIYAVVVVIRRAGADILQWRTALRLTAPIVLIWFFLRGPLWRFDTMTFAGLGDDLGRLLPAFICVWILSAIALVAAESLLYEKRPEVMAGLDDISRGRFRIPELVPAALAGYALGLTVLGLGVAALASAGRLGITPVSSSPMFRMSFEHSTPSLMPLFGLGIALPTTALALFTGATFQGRRIAAVIMAIVPTCLIGTLLYGTMQTPQLVVVAPLIGTFPLFALRFGFLASVIGITVAVGGPIALELVRVGGPFLTPGLIALAILLVPFAVALDAWRRLRAQAS